MVDGQSRYDPQNDADRGQSSSTASSFSTMQQPAQQNLPQFFHTSAAPISGRSESGPTRNWKLPMERELLLQRSWEPRQPGLALMSPTDEPSAFMQCPGGQNCCDVVDAMNSFHIKSERSQNAGGMSSPHQAYQPPRAGEPAHGSSPLLSVKEEHSSASDQRQAYSSNFIGDSTGPWLKQEHSHLSPQPMHADDSDSYHGSEQTWPPDDPQSCGSPMYCTDANCSQTHPKPLNLSPTLHATHQQPYVGFHHSEPALDSPAPFLVSSPIYPSETSSFPHRPLVGGQVTEVGQSGAGIQWDPFPGPLPAMIFSNSTQPFAQTPTMETGEQLLLSPLHHTALYSHQQQQQRRESMFHHSLLSPDHYVFPDAVLPDVLQQQFHTSPTATTPSPSVTPRGSPVSLPAAAATNRRRKVAHPPNRRHSAVNAAPEAGADESVGLHAGKKRRKDTLVKDDPDDEQDPKQVLSCPYPDCTRTFPLTSIKLLVSHLTVHSSLRPFVCEYPHCDKSFARQHDAFRHYRSMHERPSFECPFCKARFSRKDTLKDHMAMALTRPCPIRANRGMRARSASVPGPAAQPG
ncbi:hypothetical protein HDU87_003205 [Geranomyces variabilis]|uniref:C2H2-type domain-containing protein n=1 Tax=Geranomyces variabilis TaxID=109894 RepID=A0AAD5XRI1_9FUNG|nr:hypothetical protein HDU87_003205 [Geranomyces variabilis]